MLLNYTKNILNNMTIKITLLIHGILIHAFIVIHVNNSVTANYLQFVLPDF